MVKRTHVHMDKQMVRAVTMHGETSDATVAKFVRGWILIYVENMSTVRCNNVEPTCK